MNRFKIGDVVVCVDDDNFSFIEKGREYSVLSDNGGRDGNIIIEDDEGDENTYSERWFVLKESTEESNSDKVHIMGPIPHSHYFKDVSKLTWIDVYRTLSLFNVTDPCLQHAIKKLLVAGGRGAGKDIGTDVQEAIDSLERWKEIKEEDKQ